MQIEEILISDIENHPKNPKQHPETQIRLIQKSIERFGWTNPVILDKNNRILAGHARVKAAIEKGYNTIPAIKTELSGDEADAYLIADNRLTEIAQYDRDILAELLSDLPKDLVDLTGFDTVQVEALLSGEDIPDIDRFISDSQPEEPREEVDAEPQIDRAAELNEKWQVKPGDLWELGLHRLVCGDCTDPAVVERVMQGEKADVVETDPPYGVNYAAKNRALNTIGRSNRVTTDIEGDTMSAECAAEKIWGPAFANVYEHTRNGGVMYCFSPQGGDQMMMMMMMMIREKWSPRLHQLIWKKNSPTFSMGRIDYQYQHEPIHYTWKGTNHSFYGESCTSIIECNRPSVSKLHPTMKPVELIETLISNSSLSGGIILDPFLGSGTTMIACENTGRKCRGIEISPDYCAVILQRFKDATGKEPVKING